MCKIVEGPVDWKAAKQKTVTTSITEAELLPVSEAGKSMRMWMRIFDRVMFNPGHPVSIQCDNKQTVQLLTKEAPQLRTKLHILTSISIGFGKKCKLAGSQWIGSLLRRWPQMVLPSFFLAGSMPDSSGN
jgi:hypothetical protein